MKNKQFVINQISSDIDIATDILVSEVQKPKENQVLVKNNYVGINAVYDREMYKGKVPYIQMCFPYVFGVESVGQVIECGSQVNKHWLGKSVSILKVGSAYQEYLCIDVEYLVEIPEATAEYLTINPTGVSAHLALQETAQLQSGDTVVVSAAAGGLGHILVQLCKKLDCHVLAICGGPEKKSFLESLDSCDRIIDYKNESIREVINNEYKNKIDVGFDSVGQNMFDNILDNLANKGRLVVIGLASELAQEQFEKLHQARVYEKIYWKGASIRCFMNHLYKEKHEASRAYLFELYQKQQLIVKPDKTEFTGIESIKEASKYLLAGKSCGKVVVKI